VFRNTATCKLVFPGLLTTITKVLFFLASYFLRREQ
jgi:hypothetical protein